jgi:hypothetical protein
MSTVRKFEGEVVLEIPWHKLKFWFSDDENFVFCQEKGANLFFSPDFPSLNPNFLFSIFPLLFLFIKKCNKSTSSKALATLLIVVFYCCGEKLFVVVGPGLS